MVDVIYGQRDKKQDKNKSSCKRRYENTCIVKKAGKIMINDSLVSVIIPVYNVEKYLRRCVKSVMEQTYSNIEIILINDGSTDRSGEICCELEKEDERIVLVVKDNNEGVSSTRNTGLKMARGEYITFIDSDDYVSKDYIETLLHLCIKNNAEISECSLISGSNDNYRFDNKGNKEEIFCGIEYLRNMYSFSNSEGFPCKLYKRYLFEGIECPVGRIMEDVATTYKVAYRAKRVVYIREQLYYYFRSNDSIIRSKFGLYRLDGLKLYEERFRFFLKIGERELYERAQQQYEAVLLKWYYCVKKYYPEEKITIKEMHKKICETYLILKKSHEIKTVVKIGAFIGTHMPYCIGMICDRLIL